MTFALGLILYALIAVVMFKVLSSLVLDTVQMIHEWRKK